MKQISTLSGIGLMCIVLCAVIGCTGEKTPETTVEASVVIDQDSKIEWAGTWDIAFSKARSEEKVVLVTFYADWCIWCKRLEDTTLADSSVASFVTAKTVPVRLDVDGDGRELSNKYRVDGLPTILVLSVDGEELGRIPGYLPPASFLERIRPLAG